MKDRRITVLDEDAVIREAGKISAAVWKRYHDSF
jgi:hypothetical protein